MTQKIMAFECNIDSRGKAFRLRIGIIALAIGIVMLGIVISGILDIKYAWVVPIGIISGGLFSIFEARMGWCVVRALGFRAEL